MSHANQIPAKRIVLAVLGISLVLIGHWLTNWSMDYIFGVSIGMVVMAVADYTD